LGAELVDLLADLLVHESEEPALAGSAGRTGLAGDPSKKPEDCRPASCPDCDGFGGPYLIDCTKVCKVFEARCCFSYFAFGLFEPSAFITWRPTICSFSGEIDRLSTGSITE